MQSTAKVLKHHPGVINLHLKTETRLSEGNIPHMSMLYKISNEPVEEDLYGIQLARVVGFPDTFIQCAERTARELQRRQEAKKMNSASRKMMERRKLVVLLHQKLEHLETSSLTEPALKNYLRKLQRDFIAKMEAIDGDSDEAPDEMISRGDARGAVEHDKTDDGDDVSDESRECTANTRSMEDLVTNKENVSNDEKRAEAKDGIEVDADRVIQSSDDSETEDGEE